jgi:hypothetical protein
MRYNRGDSDAVRIRADVMHSPVFQSYLETLAC